jgi:UDP-glucose 4-epimerase
MKVLVTGGAGYIGSHVCIELLDFGHDVLVLDNLTNGKLSNLEKVAKITKISLNKNGFNDLRYSFIKGDIRNKELLTSLFLKYEFDAVIHLAGLKSISESIVNPEKYFDNNVDGFLTLIKVMEQYGCKTIIFSSSASVYGITDELPLHEDAPLMPNNPYSKSKLMIENFLRGVFLKDENWGIAILRYFNPVGAHSSGLIGDNPNGAPSNLMPFIAQVASGKRPELIIFGDDYNTPDGTGIRDYIHVVDLASSHLNALRELENNSEIMTLNIGTGIGYSVLDLVKTFEKVTNIKIPFKFNERRKGDVAACYTDPSYAFEKIAWQASKDIEDMCLDAWFFEKNN